MHNPKESRNSNLLFTVIIPVYNREKLITRSIASVISQTYTNFEIICINDGSTDNSEGMINAIQQKDHRVKLITLKKNSGRCIARNKGILEAKGDWLCFLDSDDYYLENHLETLCNLIKKNPDYDAYCTSQSINKANPNSHLEKVTELKLIHFLRTNPIQINQLCISKNVNLLFPNERIPISEDWFFFRMLAQNTTILKSSIVTNILIDHNDRTVRTTDWIEFTQWNAYTGILFAGQENTAQHIRAKFLSFTYLLCTNILLSNKLKKESIGYFKKSLWFPYTYLDSLFYKALIKYLIK